MDEVERKARYERAKVGVMREDLNLNGEDTILRLCRG